MAVVIKKYMEMIQYLSAAHFGYTYQQICEHFGISDATARRMIRELKKYFNIPESEASDSGGKLFKILGVRLRLQDFEQYIHDVGLAAELFAKQGLPDNAGRLRALQNQLLGTLQGSDLRRIEPDLELLGQEEGWAMRPGPRAEVSQERLTTLREALLARRCIEVDYKRRRDGVVETVVLEPHGIIFGNRNYLVAFVHGKPAQRPKLFVIVNMENIKALEQFYVLRAGFNFQDFVSESFGVWHGDNPFDVVWRFSANAAEDAMQHHFHPTEKKRTLPDGRVEVSFQADGLLEMAFHLFTWEEPWINRSVEIVQPTELRDTYRAMLNHALKCLDASKT